MCPLGPGPGPNTPGPPHPQGWALSAQSGGGGESPEKPGGRGDAQGWGLPAARRPGSPLGGTGVRPGSVRFGAPPPVPGAAAASAGRRAARTWAAGRRQALRQPGRPRRGVWGSAAAPSGAYLRAPGPVRPAAAAAAAAGSAPASARSAHMDFLRPRPAPAAPRGGARGRRRRPVKGTARRARARSPPGGRPGGGSRGGGTAGRRQRTLRQGGPGSGGPGPGERWPLPAPAARRLLELPAPDPARGTGPGRRAPRRRPTASPALRPPHGPAQPRAPPPATPAGSGPGAPLPAAAACAPSGLRDAAPSGAARRRGCAALASGVRERPRANRGAPAPPAGGQEPRDAAGGCFRPGVIRAPWLRSRSHCPPVDRGSFKTRTLKLNRPRTRRGP